MEDTRVRIGIVANTAALRQNLVELNSHGHGHSRQAGRHEIMKREDVVLRCDR